ncbi:MAG: type II secretion system protein [Akkermansiaceae bacterium]|nr:type II secretion system protein [Akkermansiaceae bacterium]
MHIKTSESRHHHGFTLVELLVVIAIIAALVALSFTVVTKMVSRSKTVASVNNLKQLHIAAEGFAGDNHGVFPATYWGDPDSTPPGAGKMYWWQALAPYVYSENTGKLDGTFRDKADPNVSSIKDSQLVGGGWGNISYMPWTNGSVPSSSKMMGISVSRTEDLGGQPYLSTSRNTGTLGVWNEAQYNKYVVPSAAWRDNKIIVLYCDGAVKVVKDPTFQTVAPAMDPDQD